MNLFKALSLCILPVCSPEAVPVHTWPAWEVLPASARETSWVSEWHTHTHSCGPLGPGMRSAASFWSSVSWAVIPAPSLWRLNERHVCKGCVHELVHCRHLMLGRCGGGDWSYVQGLDSSMLLEQGSGLGGWEVTTATRPPLSGRHTKCFSDLGFCVKQFDNQCFILKK